MVEKKVRILSGSYSSVGDGVVIELFGRTEDGDSVTLLYDEFRPYFHLVNPPNNIVDELRRDEEIVELKDRELWVDGEVEPCKKVILRYPFKVPGYRNKFKNHCQVLAADIPYIQRFIYDKDLGSTVIVEGEKIDDEKYTTDSVLKVDQFQDSEPLKPELKILSFDIENSIEDNRIYTICCVVDHEGERKSESFYGDEKQILEDFQDYINSVDPDVITGYNINGYDLPLLEDRAEVNGIDGIRIGRDGNGLKKVGNRYWRVNGRIIADAWWSVRKEMNLKRETLDHVSKELLGREKDDVDPKEIDREWDDDKNKVINYCTLDAELALDILIELESLDRAMDMATVSKLPVDEGLNGRTSTLVDSILIREADRKDIGVPLTSHKGKGSKIKGGYVHSIEPGLYHWVSVLDFKSMYPSIIMENNICFTTLSEKGKIESPTGAKFLDLEQKKGILPGILKDLMAERDEVKEKMKNADKKKEKKYYGGLQAAIKVLMNSFYGVFASSFYRFTDKRIGESITAFARKNIKELIEELQADGLKVIYSDTDSVFFQSPEENLEDTIKISRKIAEDYSRGAIILEFEKVLNPFFSHGMKKRYVGKVIWPEEDMLVRGYELRRSDSFEAQNRALEEVFEHILDDDIDGAIDTAKMWIEKTKNSEVDPEELVISRTCKRYSYYKNPDSMPNVQAAQKMERKGYEFTPGMKVSWVVTNAHKTPQDVEPWLPDSDLDKEPDWNYYARRIAKTLARVTDVFGWDEEGLLAGNKQSDLFSGDFKTRDTEIDEDPSGSSEDEKKTVSEEENMSLEDFM
ncbi:MAG: DNA polymerase domain-containing protein [Candidatus Saliniplasma sp.]